MSPRKLWLKLRRSIRSARWSIGSGWSDLWTLRRWIMSLRMVWIAFALVGAIATYAWGFGDSESSSAEPIQLPEAQMKTLCEQAAPQLEREARRFEEEMGRPMELPDC